MLLLALATGLATRLATSLGRIQTMLFTDTAGTLLLLALALVRDRTRAAAPGGNQTAAAAGVDGDVAGYGVDVMDAAASFVGSIGTYRGDGGSFNGEGGSFSVQHAAAASLFSVRAALVASYVAMFLLSSMLQSCTYPLTESIAMDFVPPHTRARWKSLDAVGRFGWSGSAVLGGYMADARGYTFAFVVSAGLCGVCIGLRAGLLGVVPRKEAASAEAALAAEHHAATAPALECEEEGSTCIQ